MAAADIVLTEPGLSTIVDAIWYSRKIFQRMKNYVLYRIACTLQLLFFIFLGVLSVDPRQHNFGGDFNQTQADVAHAQANSLHSMILGGPVVPVTPNNIPTHLVPHCERGVTKGECPEQVCGVTSL